jgi:hypothetical protein
MGRCGAFGKPGSAASVATWAASLQAASSSVVALLCRRPSQRAGAGGITELWMPRLLERDQGVERAGFPQLG